MLVVSTAFEAVERIRRALGARFVVVRCASVAAATAELERLRADGRAPAVRSRLAADERRMARHPRLAGLVLEAVDAQGRPTAPLVAQARAWWPGAELPVVALVRRTSHWCAASIALIEAQPSVVAVAEELDLASVVRALADRLQASAFVSSVWDELEPEVPPALRPLLRFALARAAGPLSVQGLADGLGLHRKTLWSRCRREGVENVQELLTWCRLLAAEHVLRSCTRPVDAVAEELAFASPTALRNAIRRHVGTTATAVRAPDAPRAVCEGFRAWMRGQRVHCERPPAVTVGDMR